MKHWISKQTGFLVLALALTFSTSASFGAIKCEDVYDGSARAVTEKTVSRTKVEAFATSIFTPGNAQHGPSILALLRYGEAIAKGSTFRDKGETFTVLDWGKKADGKEYVRVQAKDGSTQDLAFSQFPARAFTLRTIKLDDVMKYQNELVLDRVLRDHPGMSPETAQLAFDEMKKWFFVKFRAQIENFEHAPYMYNEIDTIDYVWHAFLLFTNHYAEFGQKYFATFLHHKTQSFMDSAGGVIRAMPEDGRVKPAEANRDQIIGYMRETLGDDTYRSWFVRQDFNPYTREGINKDRPQAKSQKNVKPGSLVMLETPIYLSTRVEVYAKSYPVVDARGNARTDLPLYHVRKNQHYNEYMSAARRNNPSVNIVDYPLTTEVNAKTRNLLHKMFFKENSLDKAFGEYFETFPSPELFEHQRKVWNASHPAREQIVVGFERRSKGDTQDEMVNLWDSGYDIGIAIMDTSLDNPTVVKEPDPKDENVILNNDPVTYKPALVDVGQGTKTIADTNHLLLHDIGQWVNAIWIDNGTLKTTEQVSRFYDELRQVVVANGKGIEAPMIPMVRTSLDIGAKPKDGYYSARRLLLDAVHDSQRGIHSITHMLVWLIRNPKGFVPGGETINDHGPIVKSEFRTHLQGMGVKPVGSAESPNKEANFQRTWSLARESSDAFTLEDALKFVINKDRERAIAVVDALRDRVKGVDEVFRKYEAQGAFKTMSDAQISQLAREMRWRYDNMGRDTSH